MEIMPDSFTQPSHILAKTQQNEPTKEELLAAINDPKELYKLIDKYSLDLQQILDKAEDLNNLIAESSSGVSVV